MRSIIIAIMCAATASAQPWIDHAGRVAWRLPAQYHAPDKTVIINPTLDQLRPYGWAEAEQIAIVEIITNRIDVRDQLRIETYKNLVQAYMGQGAHTNISIDAEMVMTAMMQAGASPERLDTMANIEERLRVIYPGHFSALPYGKTETVVTNIIPKWLRAK